MVAAVLLCTTACAEGTVASDLASALAETHAAGVVVDLRSGAVLASFGEQQQGTPGSTLKPLLLDYALDHGVVNERTQVYCRRNLHIAGRALPCTHPAAQPVFDAESALAESCNTWFAAMAQRLSGPQLETALTEAHLRHAAMKDATVEQRQLAVLGVAGVTVTPLELARAYRNLLLRIVPDGVVARGLKASVDYGMANPARVEGMTILGKTGTASDLGEAWTHGWFVGALPGQVVVVIYVPHGDGGTAARLGQAFFHAEARQGRTP